MGSDRPQRLLKLAFLLVFAASFIMPARSALLPFGTGRPRTVATIMANPATVYVSMAFASRLVGILVAVHQTQTGSHCALEVYSTTNGASSWSAPEVLRTGRDVCEVSLANSVLSACSSSTWWVAFGTALYTGHFPTHPATSVPTVVRA